jgi:hypothetical protein
MGKFEATEKAHATLETVAPDFPPRERHDGPKTPIHTRFCHRRIELHRPGEVLMGALGPVRREKLS